MILVLSAMFLCQSELRFDRLWEWPNPHPIEMDLVLVRTLGDLDGDSYSEFLVSGIGESYFDEPGRVYVFRGLDRSLAAVHEPDPTEQGIGRFGLSVCLGEIDGDPDPELLIGDPEAEIGGEKFAGRVLAVDPLTGVRVLILPGTDHDLLGKSVASGTDLAGDGIDEVLAGASGWRNDKWAQSSSSTAQPNKSFTGSKARTLESFSKDPWHFSRISTVTDLPNTWLHLRSSTPTARSSSDG